MNKNIFGAAGVSLLLLCGSAPTFLVAQESPEPGDQPSRYEKKPQDLGEYDQGDEDEELKDEDDQDDAEDEDDSFGSYSTPIPPPDDQEPTPGR